MSNCGRILVTGSNGFIGKHLIDYVHTVVRDQLKCVEYQGQRLGQTSLDIEHLCKKYSGIDTIVHLAANISFDLWNQDLIRDNLTAVQQILQIASSIKAKKIIYMSSTGIYSPFETKPISEQNNINCQSVYHLTKFWGEQLIQVFQQHNSDVGTIIFRLSSPIGQRMRRKTFITELVKKCQSDQEIVLFGKGSRVQNYIDVRDVCGAIVKAINTDIAGVFNLGGDRAYSNLETARICRNILGSKSPINFSGIDEHDNEQWEIDISRLKNVLGYVPQYSLSETLKWMGQEVK